MIIGGDKVYKVSLELHNRQWADGNNIWIDIIQGRKSCRVQSINNIKTGETQIWSTNRNRGTCSGATFDTSTTSITSITFKMKTSHRIGLWSNQFYPKRVTITIGKTVFYSKQFNHGTEFVDDKKGHGPHYATKY